MNKSVINPKNPNTMKKFHTIPIVLFVALSTQLLFLTGCTKEDPAAWIDNTTWKYTYKNSEGYTTTCALGFKKGGEIYYYDGFPRSYGYAYSEYRYYISSYTYDGGQSGTLQLRAGNHYASDGQATFTINYDQKKLNLSTPDFYCTLERTK